MWSLANTFPYISLSLSLSLSLYIYIYISFVPFHSTNNVAIMSNSGWTQPSRWWREVNSNALWLLFHVHYYLLCCICWPPSTNGWVATIDPTCVGTWIQQLPISLTPRQPPSHDRPYPGRRHHGVWQTPDRFHEMALAVVRADQTPNIRDRVNKINEQIVKADVRCWAVFFHQPNAVFCCRFRRATGA